MNRNSMRELTKIMTFVCGMLITSSSLAGVILASSAADWDAARNNGIDQFGNSVAAGSALDAPEQGHAATSNGTWKYKATNGPGSGPFSGGEGLLDWDTSLERFGSGQPSISRTLMSSTSTLAGTTHSVREWFGTDLGGELVNISGSFTTKATGVPIGPLNNGMHVYVIFGSSLLGEALLAPNEQTYSFNFENIAVSGPNTNIRFAAGPDGPIPGANTVNDFFSDGVHFNGQIELVTANVPEPTTFMLLLSGLLLIGWQRRRHPNQDTVAS